TILDTVLLPGTAFVELALHAAAHTGGDRVADLTLEAPLVVPGRGAVQVQAAVGTPDGSGRRSFALHSRPVAPDADGPAWTRHATGTLAGAEEPGAEPASAAGLGGDWVPAGAEAVDVTLLHERLTELGLGYGPLFQGLYAAWRHGAQVYAEVRLPEAADAGGFALHPALLDAALHPVALGTGPEASPGAARSTGQNAEQDGEQGGGEPIRLPFSWSGVTLHATGATRLRVLLSPAGPDAVRLAVADPDGAPVLTVDSLTVRPVDRGQVGAGRAGLRNSLFSVDWAVLPADGTAGATTAGRWAVLGAAADLVAARSAAVDSTAVSDVHPDLAALSRAVAGGAAVPDVVLAAEGTVGTGAGPGTEPPVDTAARARASTHRVLALLQGFLTDDALAAARLVVVTRGAVAAGDDDGVSDLAASAVWGLVRSAQAEHPDRIVLVDLDASDVANAGGTSNASDASKASGTSGTSNSTGGAGGAGTGTGRPLPSDPLTAAVACGEPQLAVRAGELRVPRLVPAEVPASGPSGADAVRLDPDGTVLITGGTGTLG
ncbi:polyketide synthase dehydratase domain-containing protein, partial [Streptomyces sulfonofaciens]|uniref:polyketide synthase dehydratase domain-containing protein n=1 Tax=Streptomyces sulfonofaciens TaxID=68272 RepID=UPI00167B16C9